MLLGGGDAGGLGRAAPDGRGPLSPRGPSTAHDVTPHRLVALDSDCSSHSSGFIFARYISGLAKQAEWKNLRAGSAFAVGTVLLALAMAVGHTIDAVGPDAVLRYLLIIAPGFVALIGLEIVVNIVLTAYRPRRANEIPRAAFDSRLLGFLAAPDRIAKSISDAVNYQLGFDFTSGWLYQLLTRAFWPLVITGVVVTWGLSSMAVLQPHQKGTILRFGEPVRENIGPGLHFKMPWPIETVYVPEYVRATRPAGPRTSRT